MDERSKRIQALNDDLRIRNRGGRLMTTRAVAALPIAHQIAAVDAMRTFQDFNPANDPYGEHDGARFVAEGYEFFFKIDYFNLDLTAGSEDPSDPSITARILTLMLMEEY